MWRRLFAPRKALPRPAPALRVAVVADAPAPVDAGPPLVVVQDRFHRFVLGLPEATGDVIGQAEQATLRRLEAIAERFDVSGLPRLPSVLPQLLRALKNDNLAGSQLAAMIGRDPVLDGEVMRAIHAATSLRSPHTVELSSSSAHSRQRRAACTREAASFR